LGTISKMVEIDDEDILNLKNMLKELYELSKTTQKELLEIFTIQEIIRKWEGGN